MELVRKGEAVDIDATFQLLDKRISALEPKKETKNWTPAPPAGVSKTAWTPAPPKA